MERHIVIDLFDGVEDLDALGPWEVLAAWTQDHPDDGWRVDPITDDGLPRRSAKGLIITPTAEKSAVPEPDVILEPGGDGSLERLRDESHRAWLQEAARRGAIVASVCTGARVLAAGGLLHRRPFTTYHAAFDSVVALDPTAQPCPGERWIDDGQIITAAGVSAGIDMALHLVGRLTTPERAQQVQDAIEYHPAPPTWAPRS